MRKVISVINEKGGCGKTSLVSNLGYGFATKGKRVLLIDNDPQHNLSSLFLGDEGCNKINFRKLNDLIKNGAIQECGGFEKLKKAQSILGQYLNQEAMESRYGLRAVLLEPSKIHTEVVKTSYENISILPCSHDLSMADYELKNARQRDRRLRQAIKMVEGDYDVIIIDNSPFESALTYNAINACNNEGDLVLIPTKIDKENWEGLNHTITSLIEWLEESGELLGYDFRIVPSMISQTRAGADGVKVLKELFDNRVTETFIRYQGAPVQRASLDGEVLLSKTQKTFTDTGVYKDYLELVNEIEKTLWDGNE